MSEPRGNINIHQRAGQLLAQLRPEQKRKLIEANPDTAVQLQFWIARQDTPAMVENKTDFLLRTVANEIVLEERYHPPLRLKKEIYQAFYEHVTKTPEPRLPNPDRRFKTADHKPPRPPEYVPAEPANDVHIKATKEKHAERVAKITTTIMEDPKKLAAFLTDAAPKMGLAEAPTDTFIQKQLVEIAADLLYQVETEKRKTTTDRDLVKGLVSAIQCMENGGKKPTLGRG